MSSPASGVFSTPTIYAKVDFGPTFGQVYRPVNTKRFIVVPDGGTVQIIPYDVIIAIFPTTLNPVTLQLPDVRSWTEQPYGGFDLTIKYFGTTDLTVLPFAGQNIDGGASLIIGGSQGGGASILSPYYNKGLGLTGLAWYSL